MAHDTPTPPTTAPAAMDLPDTPPQLQIDGPVATITLNRPSHRNRLHSQDLVVLMQHFRQLDADTSVRVLVLTGTVLPQRPVFCAGYHIGQHGEEIEGASFEAMADALEALRPLTVCALNGSVYGGATDFALACDFALGVQGLEMRMPAAALGMHYYPGGLLRYASRLGHRAAKRAFLAAEPFNDQQLLAMGYVQSLHAPAELPAAVQALVQRLLPLAPLAQEALKRSFNEIARGEAVASTLRERQHQTQASRDFAEGCLAFAERRAPTFQRH